MNKVLLKNTFVLAAVQIACSAIIALILHLLSIEANGIAAVGLMIGARVFGFWKEQKEPGFLTPNLRKQLALGVTGVQMVLGVLFLVATASTFFQADTMARIIIFLAAGIIGSLIAFFVTLWSLTGGIKTAQKIRAKNQSQKPKKE